ncbi:transglutaminase-like cysteine peptidase [Dongia sedimenti]|uniref:Transglutaminase-like cysteine peptidase n=1 Tax=Dongia sedimenti TaxID=3064282 RepID=A0ABU0YLW0_9PROT|nr:transglutaminase-like cysteine peptidase [Rhodospirillaceae bacterium R-7]
MPILPAEIEIGGKMRRNHRLGSIGFFAAAIMLACGLAAQAVPMAPSEAPVYAIDGYPFQKAPALLRWRSVLQREAHLTERANPDDCKDGQPRLACAAKEALQLEEKLKDKTPTEQVEAVYAYFNAIKYKEHAPDCGIDCWKSRLQFLAQREGDCGDHALAEYFTLKRLGFKERDLQLIVAQLPGFEDSFKGGHVVLRVRAEDEYFILDNRRTDLADLSGLRQYKVLAGMNAESVQIYNLVTPAPPPGFIADETQVASLIASPGAGQQATEEVLVADASPSEPAPQPQPQPEPAPVIAEQPKPILVAAAQVAPVSSEEEAETACMQTAQLSDWNPMMPCTEVVKTFKLVIKPKTIIGAEPPKIVKAEPSKPVQVAETPKAPEKVAEPKVETPKAAEPKVAAKPVLATPAPAPKPEAVAVAKDEEDDDQSGACVQGATLGDWNPDLPCSSDSNSSSLRIVFND